MISVDGSATKRVAIGEGLLTEPLSNLEDVRLRGRQCCSCGEVFFGPCVACETCQNRELQDVVLSKSGKLHTFTVVRYRPPGEYKGPDPFVPFAAGLVELPDGLRIISRLSDCEFDQLRVGMPVELAIAPFCRDQDGNEVIAYSFRPA